MLVFHFRFYETDDKTLHEVDYLQEDLIKENPGCTDMIEAKVYAIRKFKQNHPYAYTFEIKPDFATDIYHKDIKTGEWEEGYMLY